MDVPKPVQSFLAPLNEHQYALFQRDEAVAICEYDGPCQLASFSKYARFYHQIRNDQLRFLSEIKNLRNDVLKVAKEGRYFCDDPQSFLVHFTPTARPNTYAIQTDTAKIIIGDANANGKFDFIGIEGGTLDGIYFCGENFHDFSAFILEAAVEACISFKEIEKE